MYNKKNKQWKSPFHTFRNYASPRTRELEQALKTASTDCAVLSRRLAEAESLRQSDSDQIIQLQQALHESARRCSAAEQEVVLLQQQLQRGQRLNRASLEKLENVLADIPGLPPAPAVTVCPDSIPSQQDSDQTDPAEAKNAHRRRVRWSMRLAGLPLLGVASAAAFWSEPEPALLAPGFSVPQEQLAQPAVGDRPYPLDEVISVPSYGKWGPPLLMNAGTVEQTGEKSLHDVPVEELQGNLLALGFDLGHKGADGILGKLTRQALEEFKLLYLPIAGIDHTPDADHLAAMIKYYADLSRNDGERFGVDSAIMASIRIASLRTDVEFSYLMELASAESNFDSSARALGSSASGLYQFTRETWLNIFKKHGADYGLDEYADKIEFYVDRRGFTRPMVRDEDVKQHILDLRHNPRVSSIMAAELVKDNAEKLASRFGREPQRTDLYLTHFLGVDAAIVFLRVMDKTPNRIASDAFPVAAKNNHSIFHSRGNKPGTVSDVYELFSRKFNTERFNEGDRI